jgi:hypothetical protein
MNDMMQYWQQEWDAHRQDFNKWQEYLFQTTTHKPESISSIAEDTDRITGNGILIGTENLSSIYHPNEKRNVPGTVGGYLDMLYSTKAGKYVIKKLGETRNSSAIFPRTLPIIQIRIMIDRHIRYPFSRGTNTVKSPIL